VIATYEDKKIVKGFIAKRKLELPVYLYEGGVPPVFLSGRGFPVTIVVDRKGVIVLKHLGPAKWDDASFRRFLESLL